MNGAQLGPSTRRGADAATMRRSRDSGRIARSVVLASHVLIALGGCTASHPPDSSPGLDAAARDARAAEGEDAESTSRDAGVLDAASDQLDGAFPDDAAHVLDLHDCTGGTGNAYYFAGDPGDFISGGASFHGDASDGWAATDVSTSWVQIDVARHPEWWWTFELRSPDDGAPLAPGSYAGAQRAAFREPGRPGLSVSGSGRGCNVLSGSFEIHEIELEGPVLRRLRASFVQHCDELPARLVGCVRYDAP